MAKVEMLTARVELERPSTHELVAALTRRREDWFQSRPRRRPSALPLGQYPWIP